MADSILEEMRRYLPHYLNAEEKRELFHSLSRYPESLDYYAVPRVEAILQGDGWRPFTLYEFDTGRREERAGIVVSNSCDIVLTNNPDAAQNVLFAPLLRLDTLVERFQRARKSAQQIDSMMSAIRRQEKTDILYLPAPNLSFPEAFVRFDQIRPEPLSSILGKRRERLFTLSQAGFCIFLIKLAIHFTRIQEGVHRGRGLS